MSICCVLQFVGGLMGVMVGVLRGMGYSFIPMAITIGFVCGFRVIWIFTVFAMFPTLEALYVSYPITWGLAALMRWGVLPHSPPARFKKTAPCEPGRGSNIIRMP